MSASRPPALASAAAGTSPPPSSSSASARPPTSPPPCLSPPCATTTTATTMPTQPITAHAQTSRSSHAVTTSVSATGSLPPPPLQQTLPSGDTQRHVAEARSAVVASLSNMVDSELQSRASILHDNAAALDKQERDVLRATEGLRREREKLAREADGAARRLKEIGNVQNWAEVLERGFLVLEETVRLANGGASGGGSYAGSSCSCSCSECGAAGDEDEDMDGGEGPPGPARDKGVEDGGARSKMDGNVDMDMDVDMAMTVDNEGGPDAWSDASRSLMEPESSAGTDTGRAKGSETASTSTTS